MLAPAKLNLFLDVLRKRPDGFHDLRTLFASVALADDLDLFTDQGGDPGGIRVRVTGTYADGVPIDGTNLAVRAIAKYTLALGIRTPPLYLTIEKNIPHGAGLGGGSSDAATALLLAARFFAREAEDGELLRRLAAELGSDCAFFLRRSAAIGSGRGEVLASLASPLPALPVLLFKPPFGIGTPEAYGALRPTVDFGERSREVELIDALQELRPVTTAFNAFEAPMEERYPVLRELRVALLTAGALMAHMTGSGSVVFGVFATDAARDQAAILLGRNFVGTAIATRLMG